MNRKIVLLLSILILLYGCQAPQQQMSMEDHAMMMKSEETAAKINFEINPKNPQPNEEVEISVLVYDDKNNPLLLDVVHEKRLHFLVVSEDLEVYQHLHSENEEEESKNGMFYLKTSFPKEGK